MNKTNSPQFTERDLITMLDIARDHLAALVKENRPQRQRGAGQARIDAIRRQLANREFIGA